MRTTTELTARFNLTSTLVGSKEVQDFYDERTWEYDEDTDNLSLFPREASIELLEAEDRIEEKMLRGEAGLLDALDFDCVSFETVEADLAVELHEQDLADEREVDFDNYDFEFEGWGNEGNDTWEKHRARQAKHRARREKIGEALRKAQQLRPDLNWAQLIGLHNAGWDVLARRGR